MILCVAVRCRALGRHKPDCDQECRGCLPRPAADGRNLCEVCTRRIGEDAVQAAFLYAELEQMLATGGGMTEKTSGTRDRGTTLNGRAVAARTLIRHTLVSWSLMISEERGIRAPRDTVTAMGEYLDKHQEWLSAHGAAGDCSGELSELAHGFPRRAAYPNLAKVVEVGCCPIRGCSGVLTAIVRAQDSLLPSVIECDWYRSAGLEDMAPHLWTPGQWDALKRSMAQAERELLAEMVRAAAAAAAEAMDRNVA